MDRQVKLRERYTISWAGRDASQPRSQKAADDRAAHYDPGDLRHPLNDVSLLEVGYAHAGQDRHSASRRTAGAPDCRHSSVSSGAGFLALFGVCVQTGGIKLESINQLRARSMVMDAAAEGAVPRLRPIMMTTLGATLGLLPTAMSRAIGSDFPTALRHCHRRRPHGRHADEHLPAAHIVRLGGGRSRRAPHPRSRIRRICVGARVPIAAG